MWVRLSIFSQLSIMQSIINYVGLCVFSLPIPLVMIERIYTLSYYHHQIRSMIYYPLFTVRSWNNGVCCMSFYILMKNIYKRNSQCMSFDHMNILLEIVYYIWYNSLIEFACPRSPRLLLKFLYVKSTQLSHVLQNVLITPICPQLLTRLLTTIIHVN